MKLRILEQHEIDLVGGAGEASASGAAMTILQTSAAGAAVGAAVGGPTGAFVGSAVGAGIGAAHALPGGLNVWMPQADLFSGRQP
ncbi:hypothetical protein C0Z17_21710 [Trinickia caryophylli]|nr:hypothetical protein C0Z17_21710 [Trinickia caryophylli]